jgi:hypothetical protein
MKRIKKVTKYGIYDDIGTVIMECNNGVVVEWDSAGTLKYRDVLLYKPHTANEEFEPDTVFDVTYERLKEEYINEEQV